MMVGYRSTTEHAIGILCCLSDTAGELVNAVYLSEQVGVTGSYVMRIIEQLKKAGLVDSVQGRHGGFLLAKPAEDISLYEVISVMEETECRIKSAGERGKAPYRSGIYQVLEKVNETVKKELSQVYLSQIA